MDPIETAQDIFQDMKDLGGTARDLSAEQVKVLRTAFEDRDVGHYLMATQIFGYRDLIPSLHLPISRFLGRWGHTETSLSGHIWTPPTETDGDILDSDRRLMICIPRECFKTSIATRVGCLYTLCLNHDATIGLFNEKEENSQSWVAAITEVVEASWLFQMLWRDMIPTGVGFWDKEQGISKPRSLKWGGAGVRFERGALGIPELSIEPRGIGGAVTGKHYTHKILDDIIGEKAATSQALMADAISWIDHSRPLERPAENGCELVVHTPWAYADVYAHMLKKWKGEYKVHKRHLLEDELGRPSLNGKSIFPGKIGTKKALQMHKADPFVFWAQYMCVPRAGKKMDFDEKWFHFGKLVYSGQDPVFAIDPSHYNEEIRDLEADEGEGIPPRLIPLQWMEKAILFDPIPGKEMELRKEPNCRHGLVAVGKDPWGRRFCFESLRSDSNETEVCEEILRFAHKWGAAYIGIEEVNFSYLYQPMLRMISDKDWEGWCPHIMGCATRGRQKAQRIREDLAPTHQQGFWYYNREGTTEIIEELTEFPHSNFKDCSDAMAYTDTVIQRPLTPKESLNSYYSSKQGSQERGITGYGF